VLETTIIETHKHVGIIITQSFDAGITTTGVEIFITPNIDVIKKGILKLKKIYNKIGQQIRWSLGNKEFELKFDITNNCYKSYFLFLLVLLI
jgi:hypothetical protein